MFLRQDATWGTAAAAGPRLLNTSAPRRWQVIGNDRDDSTTLEKRFRLLRFHNVAICVFAICLIAFGLIVGEERVKESTILAILFATAAIAVCVSNVCFALAFVQECR